MLPEETRAAMIMAMAMATTRRRKKLMMMEVPTMFLQTLWINLKNNSL
jgi:hypothetical protein